MKRITPALIIAAALAGPLLALPVAGSAQVSVGMTVNFGPPPLPYYPQPYAPAAGYIWTPGYWAYGPYGYYWVPGTWVLAPAIGLLWTPGWWGWEGGFYQWHLGYWGPQVGYYGGIDYGYGYTGEGYEGGYWHGRDFYYNRAVSNVNVTDIHTTYNRTVINNTNISRVSYNGGAGGTRVRATPQQEAFAREHHIPATAMQTRQERVALSNPAQRYSTNHGRPAIAATTRPGKFSGPGVVRMSKTRDSYVYHPVVHNSARQRAGSRYQQPVQRVSRMRPASPKAQEYRQPVRTAPPPQNNFRNYNRAVRRPAPQPAHPYARQPEMRTPPHTQRPESKPPPPHHKNDGGRPPRRR